MSLALNYQRRADQRLAKPKNVNLVNLLNRSSRSPSPREQSPKINSSIDFSSNNEMTERKKQSPQLVSSPSTDAKKDFEHWLFSTMNSTPSKLIPPYGILELPNKKI